MITIPHFVNTVFLLTIDDFFDVIVRTVGELSVRVHHDDDNNAGYYANETDAKGEVTP